MHNPFPVLKEGSEHVTTLSQKEDFTEKNTDSHSINGRSCDERNEVHSIHFLPG